MLICLILLFPAVIACKAGAVEAADIALTPEEELLICRAVRSETEGEPYLSKIALSAVIINRLPDDGFPDNISDIINDRGAFPNLGREEIQSLDAADLKEEYLALRCVINDGIDPTCGAVFFAEEENARLWEIHKSFQIGKLVFSKPKRLPVSQIPGEAG